MAFHASHLRRLAPICSLLLLLAYAISFAPAPESKPTPPTVASVSPTVTSGLLPTLTPPATPGTIDLAKAHPANLHPITSPLNDGPPQNLTDVSFVTAQTGFGVTADGGIYRSLDGGDTWQIRYRRGGARFYRVVFADAKSGQALGGSDCLTRDNNCKGPTILARTSNGGDTWEIIEPETPTPETMPLLPGLSITMLSSGVGYAVRDPDQQYYTVRGFETGMLATNDGGAHWHSVSLPPDTYASGGISFLNPLHGYIAASHRDLVANTSTSELLETTDGGRTWEVRATNTVYPFIALHFLDAQHGFVGSGGGGKESAEQDLLATDDGGSTWRLVYHHQQSFFGHPITRVHFSSLTNGWAALGSCNSMSQPGSCGGALWHTADGGHTWTESSDPKIPGEVVRFSSIGDTAWVAPGSVDYGKGSGLSILYRTTDGGASWQRFLQPAALNIYSMQWINPRIGWMDTNVGLIQTHDGGMRWTPYPLGAPVDGLDHPVFVSESVVFAVHTWDTAHYRATLETHTFMRSDDGGRTWQSVPILTPSADWRDAAVTFAGPDNGWLAFRLGCRITDCPVTIFATTDGGRSWHQQAMDVPVGYTALSFGDSNHGAMIGQRYVGPSDRRLLLTNDGGRTWTEQALPPDMYIGTAYSYSSFNAPNALGDGNLWFAGCYCPKQSALTDRFGVLAHSDDSGNHWTLLRFDSGSPYQVQFIDQMDGWMLASPNQRGSLFYVTHNGGQDWQEVWPEISP